MSQNHWDVRQTQDTVCGGGESVHDVDVDEGSPPPHLSDSERVGIHVEDTPL